MRFWDFPEEVLFRFSTDALRDTVVGEGEVVGGVAVGDLWLLLS